MELEIPTKIYYNNSTGEVILIIPEMQGYTVETTKEQDMQIYNQLKKYESNEIDYIELQYGAYSLLFKNIKSYSVNLITKKLDCIYYSKEELNKINSTNQRQITAQQNLNNSVLSVIDYLNLSEDNLNDIENYILNKKQNEIIGGN